MITLTFPATVQEKVVNIIQYRPVIEDIIITIKVRKTVTEEQINALKEMGVGCMHPVKGGLE